MCSISLSRKSLWGGLLSVVIRVRTLPSSAWRASSLWAGIRFLTPVCVPYRGQWCMVPCTCDQPSWIFSEHLRLWLLVLDDCDFVQVCSQSCFNPYLLTFHLICFYRLLCPRSHSPNPSSVSSFFPTLCQFSHHSPYNWTKARGSAMAAMIWAKSLWGLVNSIAPSSLMKMIWGLGGAGFHHTPTLFCFRVAVLRNIFIKQTSYLSRSTGERRKKWNRNVSGELGFVTICVIVTPTMNCFSTLDIWQR